MLPASGRIAAREAARAPRRPDLETQRRALVGRIEDLWDRGLITGDLLVRVREGDQILVIDFLEDGQFEVSLYPRLSVAASIPLDTNDEVLAGMCRGQPARDRGEDTAVWCFAAEWHSGECLLEIHFALRAWRDAQGSA